MIGCGGDSDTSTAPSNLVYAPSSITGTVGQAITAVAPSVTGTVASWTVSPALPAGISLSSTGTISGTPSAASSLASYTVTATNSAGSTTATIQITVNPAAPSNLSYAQQTVAASVGTAIAADNPTVTGTVTTWSVTPALPAGLVLSTTSGVISGTPAAVSPQTTYTVTAANVTGSTTAGVVITVRPVPPSNLSYTQSSIVATAGHAITPDTPTVTGTVDTWTVSPPLPAGLTLSNAGVISGTPTTSTAQANYIVTAANAGGSTQATVQITVSAGAPNFTNFQAAAVVIGQPDFVSGNFNQGSHSGTAANAIGYPAGNASVSSGILYLPDGHNNRVVGFNSVPTANDASADFVLGQTNFTYNGSGNGASQMSGPQTVKIAGGKMFVLDRGNSRVLIWNSVPTTTGVAADVVVGQSGFGVYTQSCTAVNLMNPESVEVAGGKLIVSDTQNNRILIWNTIPTANGAAADVVLGQNRFTHCVANSDTQDNVGQLYPTARTLYQPMGLWSDGTRLIATDAYNHRILIWNSIPTSNFATADVVLGQSGFTRNSSNDDNQDGVSDATPSARTFDTPYMIDSNGTQLAVADVANQRVLIWNTMPTANFTAADVVLGQSDFAHYVTNDDNQDGGQDPTPSARTLHTPSGVYFYGTHLIVTDLNNNRFLIF
jgi:hypothetical protein